MRPFRVSRWVCALMLAGLGAAPVQAGWDNVFQVCCHSCGSKPAVSNYSAGYAPAACCPQPACPQTCCSTQYVQRSYYQPVTCYQTKTYYEPVTSYQTSYYYEPVTSYRYSCYYDPCTCSYQQVACPTTCYRLRSQTCASTSYLQRTCQVPVTSYRLSCYYEPVTTCTTTPGCCASPCSAPAVAAPAVQAPPAVSEGVAPAPAPPGVSEQRNPPAGNGNGGSDVEKRYYPQPSNPPPMPPANGTGYRPAAPAPAQPSSPPPVVKLDRIVSLPAAGGQVQGQVVQSNNAPRPGAKLVFVSAEKQAPQETVTADNTGRFNVKLSSGGWLVYMTGNDGKSLFHSKIDVRGEENRQVVLVSR
ncbi:MAG: hypothetical protein K2R98_03085 [Gemmataceae bacterium]|nr:hypothetical protein [Gemmataceae bacterium]